MSPVWTIMVLSPTEVRQEHKLRPGTVVLGRRQECDIVIEDEAASRLHAEIEVKETDQRIFLTDLNSTNGTFVNGKRITGTCQVQSEDKIRIGKHLISVAQQDSGVLLNEIASRGDENRVPLAIKQVDTRPTRTYYYEAIENYAVLLNDLGRELITVTDLQIALQTTEDFIKRLTGADECSIVLAEDLKKLEALGISHSLSMQVMEERNSRLYTNLDVHEMPGENRGCHSMMLVPILHDLDSMGLIFVGKSENKGRPFTPNDLQLTVSASHQVELAVQRKLFEETLLHHANHDFLTQLPNRNLLLERLRHTIARNRRPPGYRFALFFIDIDDFKMVNDGLGHLVGDEMLVAMGQRLQKCTRAIDTTARFGGDEFAILYEDLQNDVDVLIMAERILEESRKPFLIDDRELYLTISIGVTTSIIDYYEAEDVLRDADIAMYHAKESGELKFCVFDTGMHGRLLQQMDTQNRLRQAVKANEFKLLYQPIVDIHSGVLVGVEALIRWQEDGKVLHQPDEFLPTLVSAGLSYETSQWVLETACAQMSAWQSIHRVDDSHSPFYVSVNLFPGQTENKNLEQEIQDVLKRSGVEPSRLWLEVTEKSSLGNEESIIKALEHLQAVGVRISLDDFGTGYSTLGQLYRFPVQVLKIDQSFIRDILTKPESPRIIQMILGLAAHLKLHVVAEGVETAEQLEFLKNAGCHYVQGFLFAPPLEPTEITDLLKSGSRLPGL